MRWISLLAFSALSFAQSITGVWDASVKVNNTEIPFRFQIENAKGSVAGVFFNGNERFVSSKGEFSGGLLRLEYDYYGTKLEAKLEDGKLTGTYTRKGRPGYPFTATLHTADPAPTGKAPNINGQWEIEAKSAKGENAWRFVVDQQNDAVNASILRIDGDTGTLSGRFDGSQFKLSHFSGVRPALVLVTPKEDGTLALRIGAKDYIARRPEAARAAGLATPSDAEHFTSVKDPNEPLHFSGKDLAGNVITEADSRFKGKVVLINVMGSWCPNCHDETPFLVSVYNKYKSRGLEIVALDFEEAEQLENPERLRAFIARYGIEYTVVLAGETSEAKDKLKQAENWNAWPTTFFVGRDGLVKGSHVGFPSKASGALYEEAKKNFLATVEKLLAQKQISSR